MGAHSSRQDHRAVTGNIIIDGKTASKHEWYEERPERQILAIVFQLLKEQRDATGNVTIDSKTASKLDECYKERPEHRILAIVFQLLKEQRDVSGNFIIDSQTASKLDEYYKEMGWTVTSTNIDIQYERNAKTGGQNAVNDGAEPKLVKENKRRRKALHVELLDPAPSEATTDFINAFEQKLKNYDIIANRIEKMSDSGTIVLLICNMSSRLESDIDKAIKKVHQEDYDRIVLIALHVKDKRALPEVRTKNNFNFQEKYRGFRSVVDIAYMQDKGFYSCSMNDMANTEMRQLFEGTV